MKRIHGLSLLAAALLLLSGSAFAGLDDKVLVFSTPGVDRYADGTPVLDIKPYYPAYDRRDATVPEWVDRLMEHYF